tara:strand:- start:2635 stop:3339 length:705 start_codon:yes stop_codon:yes gene_type:complete
MILKKIFNAFGYTFTKSKKTDDMNEIINLRLSLNPVDFLIDVGANYGDFALRHNKNFKKIYMIEPNKDLTEELSIKFNDRKKYKILNLGTSDKNKDALLFKTNDTGKTLSSIKKQTKKMKINFRNTGIIASKKIKLKRLDTILDSIEIKNKKIFLKIDTQGNDFETLKGIGKYIKIIKYIKVELPSINLYKIKYKHWDILKFLEKNSFKPVFFENISRTKEGELIEYDGFFEKN